MKFIGLCSSFSLINKHQVVRTLILFEDKVLTSSMRSNFTFEIYVGRWCFEFLIPNCAQVLSLMTCYSSRAGYQCTASLGAQCIVLKKKVAHWNCLLNKCFKTSFFMIICMAVGNLTGVTFYTAMILTISDQSTIIHLLCYSYLRQWVGWEGIGADLFWAKNQQGTVQLQVNRLSWKGTK